MSQEPVEKEQHRYTMTVAESQSLRDIAARLCIVQSDGRDAFQQGNKATLVSLIAVSSKQAPAETARLLWNAIAEVEHQQRTADVSNSTVAVSKADFNTWEMLSERINALLDAQHGQTEEKGDIRSINAPQILRRLAVAYIRSPERTFEHIAQLLALAGPPEDLNVLYKQALSAPALQRLFAELEGDSQRESQKGWPRSPIVPPRTTALIMLFLLTGLRTSAFELRFKHIQIRADGALIIETPGEPQRRYVIYESRFHAALRSYLEVIGRGHWYQRLEHGQVPEPDAFVWLSDLDLNDGASEKPFSKWAFYKPLARYAQQAELGDIGKTQLLATYAALLQARLDDPVAIRCNLVPLGERTTDVELRLP